MRVREKVALSSELALAASGAADGCVLLHTCHNGSLVRSIAHPDKQPVSRLLISAIHCRIVLGASATDWLYVFSLSGVRIEMTPCHSVPRLSPCHSCLARQDVLITSSTHRL